MNGLAAAAWPRLAPYHFINKGGIRVCSGTTGASLAELGKTLPVAVVAVHEGRTGSHRKWGYEWPDQRESGPDAPWAQRPGESAQGRIVCGCSAEVSAYASALDCCVFDCCTLEAKWA